MTEKIETALTLKRIYSAVDAFEVGAVVREFGSGGDTWISYAKNPADVVYSGEPPENGRDPDWGWNQ
jgi:hypothetical protein